MDLTKKSFGERPTSSLERRSRFPVSFRRRSVFRARITRAYVSRIKKKHSIVLNPASMANTQKTHRHPLASVKYPPATGPTAGMLETT